jgi:hypothetical protein
MTVIICQGAVLRSMKIRYKNMRKTGQQFPDQSLMDEPSGNNPRHFSLLFVCFAWKINADHITDIHIIPTNGN